jgi:peptidoglycan/xylan/chitin deacetylase (PgdA/CDA1 family)
MPSRRQRIALTFDTEHPDRPHDPGGDARLVDLLGRLEVRATFFVQGRWVEAYPDLARAIRDRGHLIGNHSHYHVRMPMLTPAGFDADVRASDRVIRDVLGVDPTPWFRFPFGAGADDPALHARLAAAGYRHVGWDVNVEEWREGASPQTVAKELEAALREAPDEAIVLLHSWPSPVVGALERLIPALRDRGATFAGVDELTTGIPDASRDRRPRITDRG